MKLEVLKHFLKGGIIHCNNTLEFVLSNNNIYRRSYSDLPEKWELHEKSIIYWFRNHFDQPYEIRVGSEWLYNIDPLSASPPHPRPSFRKAKSWVYLVWVDYHSAGNIPGLGKSPIQKGRDELKIDHPTLTLTDLKNKEQELQSASYEPWEEKKHLCSNPAIWNVYTITNWKLLRKE